MSKFSDSVDLRTFKRGKRLGYQSINRAFANISLLIAVLLRKLDDNGKAIGREHALVSGTYHFDGSKYVLQGQNPDYPYLPSNATPTSAGDLTLTFSTAIGTSDYEVGLTERVLTPGYAKGIGYVLKASSTLRIGMGSGTIPANCDGFDIEIRWG
jgi:hypothetical protein